MANKSKALRMARKAKESRKAFESGDARVKVTRRAKKASKA